LVGRIPLYRQTQRRGLTAAIHNPLTHSQLTLPYRFDHLQPHVDAVVGVVRPRHWQTRHTVVAVTQDLYPHALVVLQTARQ